MGKRPVCRVLLVGTLLGSGVGGGAVAGLAGASRTGIVKKGPTKKHPSKTAEAELKKLKKLSKNLANEKGATFEATYTINSQGQTESVTFAQAPPKLLFKTGSGSVISTGTTTLFCESASSCVSMGTTDPLASLMDLFSPTRARTFFNQAAVQIGAAKAGYSVSFSSGTYGGLASECAKVSGHGHSGKYCVGDNGLFTYASASTGGSIALTSYTPSVPGTAFTPPSGSTIVTVPST